MIRNDGKFNSVARIQAIAAASNFSHVEEQFFPLIDFIVEETIFTFDGVNDGSFLETNSNDLWLQNNFADLKCSNHS